MIGSSARMVEIFDRLKQISTSDYPVLISGESGTGKELLARAIHNESGRHARHFVPLNCGALPDSILESELFGHVRGAFTGAVRNRKGRFDLAHRGTLFLDEVNALSPASQVKLLRVLQEMTFTPVGAERQVQVDVRIVSATNRDLRRMVKEERFREDLFYRLCVVPIELPPLRQRREDLPSLVEHALERINASGRGIRRVAREAMEVMLAYPWPGNVRELFNALQFASVLCSGDEIKLRHLPEEIRTSAAAAPAEQPGASKPWGERAAPTRKLDRESVVQAMKQAQGNKTKAARLLGVGRATLYRFLKEEFD
jgi:transcriptional regulator with GAF, ATPase, and Fis domain